VSQIFINIFYSGVIFTLIALSFSTTYSATKFFNLAHAFTLTFSAYLTYLFSLQMYMTLWIAVPLAIVCTILVVLLIEIILFKRLRKQGTTAMIQMIASLGLYVLLQNLISMIWGNNIKSIRIGEVKVGNEFFGAYITDIQIITIIVCLTLFMTCLFFMKYTRIGRNIRAVASNLELSDIVGISSDRVILQAFGIGSALAAVAGILIAFDTDMRPTMGFSWLFYGVVAMIIGGVGSNSGLVGGALLLATAQHLAAYYIGSQWMDTVAYIILILFLIAKPLGFSGKRLKKIEI
jgi:branched-subunit amino acid ABC-type transport system permease component